MSRASAWAQAVSTAKVTAPAPFATHRRPADFGDPIEIASVDEQGDLRLHESTWMGPEAALKFAAWILATFGEAEP